MYKTTICPGVYLVEAPEADLRVLCGCPMDIVKLMTRKGIIHNKQKDGVSYQTGPNAILLSDVATQHGEFCNLIEFPILHMQYKQGMILPNHPNNNRTKPVLIGLPYQIHAQCNYFLRGKYGLISIHELLEAGFTEQEARDLIRLKLRFNYGHMAQAEELLDLVYMEDNNRREIRNGVFIRRRAHNVYEFSFGMASLQVDLNLLAQEKYEIPYNLDYHRPTPEYFSITHLGEGNGWDSDRAAMSSLICYQGRYFLVDAPPGVDRLLNAVGISINELEGIFHTHSHDDHFAGLTSLIRSDHRLKYYATKPVRHSVIKKLSAVLVVDESMFFRIFDCFDLSFNCWNDVSGLEVMPLFTPHPVENSIFYFRTMWRGGYSSYGHLADTCSERVMQSFLTDDPKAYGLSKELYQEVKRSYLIPADLKKVDIGGGLIHGDAEDFRSDISKKIVLCHTEKPLTSTEKEIGTNATFALADVLIPSQTDLYMHRAEVWLCKTFPLATKSDLSMLLNGTILHFSVGTILIKRGEHPSNVYLTLTGVIGGISVAEDTSVILNSGTLVGSSYILLDKPSKLTYRAESYVSVLEIPKEIYLHILSRHKTTQTFIEQQHFIDYLQNLPIFSDNVSESTLRHITLNLGIYESEPGEMIDCRELPGLYIVYRGSVGIFSNGEMNDLYIANGIFGEESVLPGIQTTYSYETVQKTIIYHIPASIISLIPVVQWKMMERLNSKTSRINFTERETQINKL